VVPTVVVFVATYVLIAARRLAILPIGRPAGALAGACGMVVLGALHAGWGLTPHEAFAAVEPNTIGLLLGMMLLAGGLSEAGFFRIAGDWLAARRLGPAALLHAVTVGSGVLSAVLVNDSVCLLAAPLVDQVARRAGYRRAPYLLALAMGSNAGSAMTLAGNPQNMLIGQLSGMEYRTYLWRAGPAALAALLTTAVVLRWVVRADLAAAPQPEEAARESVPAAAPTSLRLTLGCLLAVSVAFLAGGDLAWSALAGATVMMVLRGRDASPLFDRVSWTVLLFFGGLFVVVAGLQKTGLPAAALEAARPWIPEARVPATLSLSAGLLVGCQIVSNVPLIALVQGWISSQPDPALAWTVTAVVTTLAGNLTLLGSVANIIVVETAEAGHGIGFRRYLAAGVPVTLASTAVALTWLLLFA
jgi:Na+/H+ antiporter NhaD/arsenite permease-like protein